MPTANERAAPVRSLVGLEHEAKWTLERAATADPGRILDAPLFERHLETVAPTTVVTQSAVFFDDSSFNLTRAGHSLSVLVNTGLASAVIWLRLKQLIRRDRFHDALEVGQRVDGGPVSASVNDPRVLPVGHAQRLHLVHGRVSVVAVLTQVRHRRTGFLRNSACSVGYGVDLVEFKSPDTGAVIGRHSCLEVEINVSTPHGLALLHRLAQDIDAELRLSRADASKAQLAVWTAHPEQRP